jgi:peptidyl-prolyl cis-trans isomerase A (cyclophilin A)
MKLQNPLATLFVLCALSTHAWADSPLVKMVTSKGEITIELNADKAPKTVENFLAYVDSGFYNGTVFHRVIEDFMIQGGGLTADMEKKKTRSPVENEAKNGLKNSRGTIAMARTNDPHSATAQFFINHKDNDNLDYPSFDGWGYAVFGKVTGGMDVVDAIAGVPVSVRSGRRNVPTQPVVIESMSRMQ